VLAVPDAVFTGCFTGVWVSLQRREARILVLGLDNAGKTTILCESTALVASCAGKLGRCH
jgi:hypothetical protein